MHLTEFSRSTHRPRLQLPPIRVEISARFIATGGTAPDCPFCGGAFELSQPGPDSTLLACVCTHCERAGYVYDFGSEVPGVLMVPIRIRAEIAGRAFGPPVPHA